MIPALVAAVLVFTVLVFTVLALTIAAARATDGHRDPDDLQPPGGAR